MNPSKLSLDSNINLEDELKCIICLEIPLKPLQCQNCDSIVCLECMMKLRSTIKCPQNCENPSFSKVKPKTRFLFDNLILFCDVCNKTVRHSEFSAHKHNSDKESGGENSIALTNPDQTYATESSTLRLTETQSFLQTNAHSVRFTIPSGSASDSSSGVIAVNSDGVNQVRPPMTRERKCLIAVVFIAGLMLNLANIVLCVHFAIKIVGSKSGFQVLCIGPESFSDSICIFAFGQFAYGIVAVGQIAVGFFTISQVGVGVIFGIGQVMAGLGFTVAQVASGFKVYSMLGLAMYQARFGFGFYEILRKLADRNVRIY